jgi:hypothetical protein
MGQGFVVAGQATASRRRIFFDLRAPDGISPALTEAGGQPQVSVNGSAFSATGIGTLSAIGFGRYCADLTQAIVSSVGDEIETRYKSAVTAESPGDSVRVVAWDLDTSTGLGVGSGLLTITVVDASAVPVNQAAVYLRDVNSGNIAANGSTNSSGVLVVQHPGGTFYVSAQKAGLSFPVATKALAVGEVGTQTITGAQLVVPAATDPALCTVYMDLRAYGAVGAGVSGSLELASVPQVFAATYQTSAAVAAVSDATGRLTWPDIPRTARVVVRVPGYLTQKLVLVPDAASAEVSALASI